MTKPSEATRALLLKRVEYGEADFVVTLLTDRFGKVSALARAAKRSRKRFGGALELGNVLDARLTFGRGELATLAEARASEVFRTVVRSLDHITLAGAALELVRDLVPAREPDERVFECTLEFLRALDRAEPAREELLLAFEVRLMSLVGFEPSLDACVKTGRRAPEEQPAYFDPELGGIVSTEAGGGPVLLSGEARRILRCAVGSDWHLAAGDASKAWKDTDLSAVRRAVRAFIEARMGRERRARLLVGELQASNPVTVRAKGTAP